MIHYDISTSHWKFARLLCITVNAWVRILLSINNSYFYQWASGTITRVIVVEHDLSGVCRSRFELGGLGTNARTLYPRYRWLGSAGRERGHPANKKHATSRERFRLNHIDRAIINTLWPGSTFDSIYTMKINVREYRTIRYFDVGRLPIAKPFAARHIHTRSYT